MATKNFPGVASPQIRISAEGNLSVTGWDQESVEVRTRNEDNLSIEQRENIFTLFAEDDAELHVPFNTELLINLVEGSLSISSVKGRIEIQSVGGHLNLHATGPVSCNNISGHCKFNNTDGEIHIRNVGGHLKGSQAVGPLTVVNVGGNIKLLDVLLIDKVHAGGNIKVKLPAAPRELEALAGGNIKLWIPPEADFELEAHSGGEKVVFQSGSETQRFGANRHRTTIGKGGPLVRLSAGGNVYILNTGWEDDLISEDFISSEDFTAGWSSAYDERIQRKVQAKIRQAEIKANAATKRAEERINAAMRKAERFNPRGFTDSWLKNNPLASPAGFTWPQEPEPSRDKVTDEERMIILNMLSEKKITADEANQLLDALNGKFGK